jgi:signal peptidase I
MKLRWFYSSVVRQATEMAGHARKLLAAQRDILSPQAVSELEAALKKMDDAIESNATKEVLRNEITSLEKSANRWLKQYPNSGMRENVEVLLVAIAVAMAFRTFIFQPFKIPTGSMQPTLFGVTATNLLEKSDAVIPGFGGRVFDALVHGTFYHDIKADADGSVVGVSPLQSFGINKRTFFVQYVGKTSPTPITVWFAPDEDPTMPDRNFRIYTDLYIGKTFKKGQSILKFKEITGDHLFVDRMTYNFRKPERGEIIVFKTAGIPGLNQNQFYIKRLIGLPGDRVSIGDDRHARINGTRLDASMPHFEMVYGFDPKEKAQSDHYSGHLQSKEWGWNYFSNADSIYQVRSEHYLVFGDNTKNSLDSRYWGDFPQSNVIGKSCFVYWPISERFGWGQR